MEGAGQESGKPKRITKIKCKKGLWFFAWEIYQADTGNWDQHSLSCKDQANHELVEAFVKMTKHAAEICEIEYSPDTMITSGITLSYTSKGNCYLTITMQKKLETSNSPLILNTPARPEMPEENQTEEFCWSDELCIDIDALEEEAWKYIEGDRAQQRLDFEGAAKRKKPGGGSGEPIEIEDMNIGA